MLTRQSLHLARIFLKMFLRDRQAIFLSLFFPLIFLTVLGVLNGRSPDPVEVSIANKSNSVLAANFVETLSANTLFKVSEGDEADLKQKLMQGDATMVLVIPPEFSDEAIGTDITMYVDASQVRLIGMIMPTVEKVLLDIERKLRRTEPMFRLHVEDVQARSQRYLDFLLPGILAFTLMQISISGSGFNIVEYRRKGILKRLFVTPITPVEFITAICTARLGWCLMQVTALLMIAVFLLDVTILGSFASVYLVVVLGTIIFLCIGFCVGSVAKTQQSVGAVGNLVIMPQLFLSGVFFPIELMPTVVQPVAAALPLSFVVKGLRDICNDGSTLFDVWPSLVGVFVWIAISFVLATRLFSWKEVVR